MNNYSTVKQLEETKMPQKKRIIILPDKLFYELWFAAQEYDDKKDFYKAFTNPALERYINFSKKYKMNPSQAHILLKEIYEKSNMSFKEILNVCGLKQSETCYKYCIKIKTAESWSNGKNKCPDSMRVMILRENNKINLGNYIHLKSENISEKHQNTERVKIENSKKLKLDKILREYEEKKKSQLNEDMDYLAKIVRSENIKRDIPGEYY